MRGPGKGIDVATGSGWGQVGGALPLILMLGLALAACGLLAGCGEAALQGAGAASPSLEARVELPMPRASVAPAAQETREPRYSAHGAPDATSEGEPRAAQGATPAEQPPHNPAPADWRDRPTATAELEIWPQQRLPAAGYGLEGLPDAGAAEEPAGSVEGQAAEVPGDVPAPADSVDPGDPAGAPAPTPTATPTSPPPAPEPAAEPAVQPTAEPTQPEPTPEPTAQPTAEPTAGPTAPPTAPPPPAAPTPTLLPFETRPPEDPPAVTQPGSPVGSAEAMAFLDEVNRRRGELGLAPLRPAQALFVSAQRHSDDQAQLNFFSHQGSDGSDPGQRMAAAGYSWANWGEAVGRSAPHDHVGVVQALWDSPPHHAILFTAAFTEAGTGVAYPPDGVPYWTIDLANPR
ncbi:MAG: hypothetical protein GXY79_03405 [Chloroflexi bacterium]|nr:hypothetical protein [Chloroflexota bacterium]